MIVNIKMVRNRVRCDLWWASHAAARWMLDHEKKSLTRNDGFDGKRV